MWIARPNNNRTNEEVWGVVWAHLVEGRLAGEEERVVGREAVLLVLREAHCCVLR